MVVRKSIIPGSLLSLIMTGCLQGEGISGDKAREPAAGSKFERNTSDPTNPGYAPVRPGEVLVKPGPVLPNEYGADANAAAPKAAASGYIGVIAAYGSAQAIFLMDAQTGSATTSLMRYTGISPFPWTTNGVDQETGYFSNYGYVGVSAPSHSSGTGRDVKIKFNKKYVASLPRLAEDYAVLRFGASCPDNGYPYARIFDNEDTQNHNSYTNSISPSTMTTAPHHGVTRMEFCFVPKAASGSPQFPSGWLSDGEGVFVRQGWGQVIGCTVDGRVMSDDEDYGNVNSWDWYSMPNEYKLRVKGIMRSPDFDGDYNTEMFFCTKFYTTGG